MNSGNGCGAYLSKSPSLFFFQKCKVVSKTWGPHSFFFFFHSNMGKQSTQIQLSHPTKFSALNCIDLSNPDINQSVNLLKQVRSLVRFGFYYDPFNRFLCFITWMGQFNYWLCFFFLFQACLDSGFFYVVNHGISQEFMDEVFTQSKRFFTLPLKEKMKALRNEKHRGYTPVLDELLDPENQVHGIHYTPFCVYCMCI